MPNYEATAFVPAPIEPSAWFYKKVIERGEKERKALAEDNARLAQALAKSVMEGPPVGKSLSEFGKEAEIEKLRLRLNKSGIERETLSHEVGKLRTEITGIKSLLDRTTLDRDEFQKALFERAAKLFDTEKALEIVTKVRDQLFIDRSDVAWRRAKELSDLQVRLVQCVLDRDKAMDRADALTASLTNVRNDLQNSENAFKDLQWWREQEIAATKKALKRAEEAEATLKVLTAETMTKLFKEMFTFNA